MENETPACKVTRTFVQSWKMSGNHRGWTMNKKSTRQTEAPKKRKKRLGPPLGPRAENAAETKARILAVAVDHFSRLGFSGARTEAISKDADIGNRMIYHYFGGKEGLYVAALDHVLSELRSEELKLDLSGHPPLDGLLQMFDFTYGHFAGHPELIRMLSAENLMDAKFLRTSAQTPSTASPVIQQIHALIERGEAEGVIRAGIDPLHLYVVMVGLSYFHVSNAPTLGVIWQTDLSDQVWQDAHYRMARDMLSTFLQPVRPLS